MKQPPLTPVLDKRNALLDDSNKIGYFLDWLSEQGIHLARWNEDDELELAVDGPNALLHRYFGIDSVAEESEKLAVLEYIRSLS